jgi:phosphoadenosine phosphosulfate reductase
MEPLYERMVADRITLVIRGQKDVDSLKGPLRSGDVADGVEYLYPVQGWTDEECFTYMRLNGVEPQRFYSAGLPHFGTCLQCTAWLGDDKAAYLNRHYPEEYPRYKHNIQIIAAATAPHLKNLMKEASFCEEQQNG